MHLFKIKITYIELSSSFLNLVKLYLIINFMDINMDHNQQKMIYILECVFLKAIIHHFLIKYLQHNHHKQNNLFYQAKHFLLLLILNN